MRYAAECLRSGGKRGVGEVAFLRALEPQGKTRRDAETLRREHHLARTKKAL